LGNLAFLSQRVQQQGDAPKRSGLSLRENFSRAGC
jgi:hypothetical protein